MPEFRSRVKPKPISREGSLTSSYRGVSSRRPGRFRAMVTFAGKNYHLGTYASDTEAAIVADTFWRSKGVLYRLNFPTVAELEAIETKRLSYLPKRNKPECHALSSRDDAEVKQRTAAIREEKALAEANGSSRTPLTLAPIKCWYGRRHNGEAVR